jgi:hypothetical protein
VIPPFNDSGFLPPGLHSATLSEIEARFGTSSEIRHVQMESVRWMVDLAVRAGVTRLVLNGSFVTDIMEPNDVDVVLLVRAGFPKDPVAERGLSAVIPYLDIAIVDEAEFDYFVHRFFAFDRLRESKGMIEVIA